MQQATSISSLVACSCGFLLGFRLCFSCWKWGCTGNLGLVSKAITYTSGSQGAHGKNTTPLSLWLSLLLSPSAPAFPAPDLLWQSELTRAACQRAHSVPVPLKPPLQFITLSSVLFIYSSHESLCPDPWLLTVSVCICKHIRAEIQLSFF